MLEFLASGGGEFKPGPVTRLDRSELLCNKILLKYKRDKVSDIDIRGGRKSIPLLVFSQMFYSYWASLMAQLVKNLPAVRETWV